jgi:3D (Asp-Asp-Asp) domain-containing protein
MRRAILAALCMAVVLGGCQLRPSKPPIETAAVPPPAPPPAPAPAPALMDFTATAYSVEGETAKQTNARKGIVAADPKVLPLGTRIRVHDAGQYSGEYTVEDTGRAIDGREIDIYMPADAEAKRFGKKRVRVEVLKKARPGAS